MFYFSKKNIFSLAVGIIFTALGIFALLASFGVTFLFIPAMLFSNVIIIKIALIIAGIMLFYFSFSISIGFRKLIAVIGGIILALLGAIPILLDYNLLTFLPFAITFTIPPLILQIVLTAYGIYLIVYAFRILPPIEV